MAVDHKVVCDQCGHDLTHTANVVGYYLTLSNSASSPPPGIGVVTMMGVYPPIEKQADFCGVGCLSMWLAATYPDASAQYERMKANRARLEKLKTER